MIVKEIKIPLKLLKLEALIRRLKEDHPKRQEVEEDFAKSKAGFIGEQSLQYYFDYLPEKEYYIFHNLRLFDGVHYFQIDFLLLTSKFILILEVKNIKGTLFFDNTFNQLIRTHKGKEDGFQDPILQAKSHKSKLITWLKTNKLPNIPVEYLVVTTNPTTVIKTNPNNQNALNKVVRSNNLLNRIEKIAKNVRVESLLKKDMKKLTSQLLKHDTPLDPQILNQFNIDDSDILTGVICTECGLYAMKRRNRSWFCSTCLNWSKDAHIFALNDYALLLGTRITNKSAREFLHLPTRFIANKILISLNLHSTGIKKGKVYTLPSFDVLQKNG